MGYTQDSFVSFSSILPCKSKNTTLTLHNMNNSDAIATLEAMLKERQHVIAQLEEKIAMMTNEVAKLRGSLRGIGESINTLKGGENDPQPFRGMELTPALVKFIQRLPLGAMIDPSYAAKIMLEGGLITNAKDLYQNCYVTLTRLAKDGRIGEIEKDGRRIFVRTPSL